MRRVLLPFAAILGCALTVFAFTQLAPAPKPAAVDPRPALCDDPEGQGVARAGSVAAIFVLSTVVSEHGERNPECSFDLVTAELRQGLSRAEWKRANPINPIDVDYRSAVESGLVSDVRTGFNKPGCGAGDAGCWISSVTAELFVAGPVGRSFVAGEFLIRLVLTSGGWRVDYWGPIAAGGGVAGPSMTE